MMYVRAGEHGAFAIPYRNGRRLKPVKMLDGAIVEPPDREDLKHFPKRFSLDRAGYYETPAGFQSLSFPIQPFIIELARGGRCVAVLAGGSIDQGDTTELERIRKGK